jgi:hypothetical protein
MFNEEQRYYIFKKGIGKIPVIYLENDMLKFGLADKQSYIKDISVAAENVSGSFACDMTSDGIIHAVYQGKNGSIYYQTLPGNYINAVPVLQSKEIVANNKFLQISVYQDIITIFYCLPRMQEKFLLACQIIKKGRIFEPVALGHIIYNNYLGKPFAVIPDNEGNYRIFFNMFNDGGIKAVCRKFNSVKNELSGLEDLGYEWAPAMVRGVKLPDGRSVLCHTPLQDPSFPIMTIYNGEWIHKKLDFQWNSSGQNLFYPVVINENLIIYSINSRYIVYATIPLVNLDCEEEYFNEAGQNGWKMNDKALNPKFPPVAVSYKSLHSNEQNLYYSEVLPGYLTDGLKLFFFDPWKY